MVANEKGCWYMLHITECVLCGAGEEAKVRRPGPKPEDPNQWVDYHQFACWSHFM